MQRGNFRAQQKANHKRPPKDDWREKLAANQKKADKAMSHNTDPVIATVAIFTLFGGNMARQAVRPVAAQEQVMQPTALYR